MMKEDIFFSFNNETITDFYMGDPNLIINKKNGKLYYIVLIHIYIIIKYFYFLFLNFIKF